MNVTCYRQLLVTVLVENGLGFVFGVETYIKSYF